MHTKHLQLSRELRSAGFWTALIAAVVLVLNQVLGWGFNQATIYSLAGTAVSLLVSLHLVAAAHVRASTTSESTAASTSLMDRLAGSLEGMLKVAAKPMAPTNVTGTTDPKEAPKTTVVDGGSKPPA